MKKQSVNIRQKVSIKLDADIAFSSMIALDSVTYRIEQLEKKGIKSDRIIYDLVSNLSEEIREALSKNLSFKELEYLLKANAN